MHHVHCTLCVVNRAGYEGIFTKSFLKTKEKNRQLVHSFYRNFELNLRRF